MQLHPHDENWNNEIELLKEKQLIGIGDYWTGEESQVDDFVNNIKIK